MRKQSLLSTVTRMCCPVVFESVAVAAQRGDGGRVRGWGACGFLGKAAAQGGHRDVERLVEPNRFSSQTSAMRSSRVTAVFPHLRDTAEGDTQPV